MACPVHGMTRYKCSRGPCRLILKVYSCHVALRLTSYVCGLRSDQYPASAILPCMAMYDSAVDTTSLHVTAFQTALLVLLAWHPQSVITRLSRFMCRELAWFTVSAFSSRVQSHCSKHCSRECNIKPHTLHCDVRSAAITQGKQVIVRRK